MSNSLLTVFKVDFCPANLLKTSMPENNFNTLSHLIENVVRHRVFMFKVRIKYYFDYVGLLRLP